MAIPSAPPHDTRGRAATKPWEIPWPGWKEILRRVKDELNRDNISFVAAGVAFYALLSIFPAFAAVVAIYGLIADPADIQTQFATLSRILPPDAARLLETQLRDIAAHANSALSLGLVASLGIALWSAAKGMNSLITALNIAYEQEEKRSFLQLTGLSLALTAGTILFAVLALVLIVGLPAVFGVIGLGGLVAKLIAILTWPLLGIGFVAGLAVLYHYAPCRDAPRWQWVSPGAVMAAVMWLVGSALFSFYVVNFGSYNETYGSVGGMVILLTWFYLTAFAVLMGTEVNAEMEHQTAEDTTVGDSEPLGQRGAYVADTLGGAPEKK